MKTINLSRGRVAIIDDLDYKLISKHKWHFSPQNSRNSEKGYAVRKPDGRSIYMHRVLMSTNKEQQ